MKASTCSYNCGSGIVIYEKNHFRSVELNDAIVEFQCDHFSWDTLKLSDVITLQGKTYYVTALWAFLSFAESCKIASVWCSRVTLSKGMEKVKKKFRGRCSGKWDMLSHVQSVLAHLDFYGPLTSHEVWLWCLVNPSDNFEEQTHVAFNK